MIPVGELWKDWRCKTRSRPGLIPSVPRCNSARARDEAIGERREAGVLFFFCFHAGACGGGGRRRRRVQVGGEEEEGVGWKELGQTRPTSMTQRTERVGRRAPSASGYHPPPPEKRRKKKGKDKRQR